ncbi:MAG TPA: hypothetical protein VN723_00910 [Rhizomicrobium sp.]|jgi:hypothetical protein|nr:hypothetical protein [Rhizomicrobium sp.]
MAATPANYRLKGHIYSWLGLLLIVAAAFELFYEAIFWLRFGAGANISIGFAFERVFGPESAVGWAGVNAILAWIGRQQLGVTLLLAGLASAWWGGINHDTAMRREISADLPDHGRI